MGRDPERSVVFGVVVLSASFDRFDSISNRVLGEWVGNWWVNVGYLVGNCWVIGG